MQQIDTSGGGAGADAQMNESGQAFRTTETELDIVLMEREYADFLQRNMGTPGNIPTPQEVVV